MKGRPTTQFLFETDNTFDRRVTPDLIMSNYQKPRRPIKKAHLSLKDLSKDSNTNLSSVSQTADIVKQLAAQGLDDL
jgi:hypothetical protein